MVEMSVSDQMRLQNVLNKSLIQCVNSVIAGVGVNHSQKSLEDKLILAYVLNKKRFLIKQYII